MTLIEPGSLVLFQGDSITDCHRNRTDINNLGLGYPLLVASMFSAFYPKHRVDFINKGISGDRTEDLVKRWQQDCIELKPDYVSIMIGINDVWRRYDENNPTSLESFTNNYRIILDRIVTDLKAKIIILEPFLLHTPKDRLLWREDLDPKRKALGELVKEYNTIYIPMDEIFQKAALQREPSFWCHDGVHPTHAGHGLIAKHWLEAVKAQ